MANHASDRLIYARFSTEHADLLSACYPFKHWHISTKENFIWVKNILEKETKQVPLQRIPSLLLLEQVGDQLHPYGRLLPWGPLPELDWQPLQTALTTTLPPANSNFLGLREQLMPRLVPSEQPRPPVALLVALESLCAWVERTPAWRLEALTWTVIRRGAVCQALVLGHPLPALNGLTYWQAERSLLPAGYAFDEEAWSALLAEYIGTSNYWFWETDGRYVILAQSACVALTRSSVRQTQARLNLPA